MRLPRKPVKGKLPHRTFFADEMWEATVEPEEHNRRRLTQESRRLSMLREAIAGSFAMSQPLPTDLEAAAHHREKGDAENNHTRTACL